MISDRIALLKGAYLRAWYQAIAEFEIYVLGSCTPWLEMLDLVVVDDNKTKLD